MGYGITVGQNAVAMLMQRAGLMGLPGARRPHRRLIPTDTAADLVDRKFTRTEADRLWVTDITEHRTREGKVYCAVVLDVFSRRVVGWSIDSSPKSSLVTSALRMAIENRRPDGTVIHRDQGTRPIHFLGVHPPGQRIRACPLDGIGRGLPVNRPRWRTRIELANAIFEYLEVFHKRQRRHSRLGMRTPIEYERIHHDNQPASTEPIR
jgi:transposase InsO family protein